MPIHNPFPLLGPLAYQLHLTESNEGILTSTALIGGEKGCFQSLHGLHDVISHPLLDFLNSRQELETDCAASQRSCPFAGWSLADQTRLRHGGSERGTRTTARATRMSPS